MMKVKIHQILILLLMTGACTPDAMISGNISVDIKETNPTISKVIVKNDQLIVTGRNLNSVSSAKIEGSTNHTFTIESKTENQIVLNAKSAVSFLVGQTFNLIIANAKAAASFPVSFELQNGQVTATKLHHMGASTGQFLQFNGTSWAPASISTNQVYVGTYDAASNTPDLTAGVAAAGTYYIVTATGTQDLGNGSTTFNVGDWVISDGTDWSQVSVGTNTVSNFNGRTGAVVPLANDYSWSMLTKAAGKLTGSKISEIADVDVVGIQDGDILQWNVGTSKWEVNSVPAPSIAAGSITNTQLANSIVDSNKILDGAIVNADVSATAAIAQSKIFNLTTDLGNKEPLLPTGGTTAQYLRGDKALATLDTSVVPENINQYFTPARVLGTLITTYATGGTGAIAVTDTIPQALSKLETKTNALGNYVLRDGTAAMTGDLQMGGNKITGLDAPTANADAATKAYVDSVAGGGGSSQWTTTGSNIYYNTGKVGIGVNAPDTDLHIYSAQPQATAQPHRAGMIIEGEGDSFGGRIATRVYSDDEAPFFIGYRAFGTKAAPTAVASGKALVNIVGYGYDGTNWSSNSNSPLISIATSQAWTATAKGSKIGFRTTPNGTAASQDRLLINHDGNVAIGAHTPTEKLHVDGNVLANGIRMANGANYVELKAPTLSSSVSLTLPVDDGTNNQVLTTDGSGNLSWTTPASGGAPTGTAGGDLDGTYPNPTIKIGLDATKIGAGGVTSTEFGYLGAVTSDIQAQLNGKEASLPTGGTTVQYFRGNKTLATFDTDVYASIIPMGFVASGAGAVAPIDSMLTALAKLQGQINSHTTSITANTTWTKTGTTDVKYTGGNVGINRDPAANTRLDVEGQIRSKSGSSTTNTVDFSLGNAITNSYDCAGTINLANIRDGGSYTLVITGAGTAQCNFNTTTTGDDANTVSYRFQPANTVRTASTHTIYSMLRVNNIVYVSWITGF